MQKRFVLSMGQTCALILSALTNASCAKSAGTPATHSSSRHKSVAHAEQPLLLDVPAATVVTGFVDGRLRRATDVPSFQITKHPITREQYQKCVGAGVCQKLDKPSCDLTRSAALATLSFDSDLAPALCVGQDNARAYCQYVGGELPQLGQWLYAARGPQPQRFAWGGASPTCEFHPRLERLVPPSDDNNGELVRTESCARADEGRIEIGQHAAGASPLGMEDVLLAPAELLSTEPSPLFSACDPRFAACLVTSSTAGSIDSVQPIWPESLTDHGASDSSETALPYAFRCVVEG